MRAEGSGQRTLPEQLGKQTISCYEAAVTLARLTEVLAPAAASGVGLGAFNVPGMTKINIATHLNHVFTGAVREVWPPTRRWSTVGGISARLVRPSPSRQHGCCECSETSDKVVSG